MLVGKTPRLLTTPYAYIPSPYATKDFLEHWETISGLHIPTINNSYFLQLIP